MANSKSSQGASAAISDVMQQFQRTLGATPMTAPQMEQFWKAQDHLLEEAERFSQHWFERRHAAARTALEAAQDMRENGAQDPAAAMKAMGDWQAESAQRLMADWQEWIELCSRCAGHLAAGGAEARQETGKSAAPKTSGARKSTSSGASSSG